LTCHFADRSYGIWTTGAVKAASERDNIFAGDATAVTQG
jgi:hypothetical protein